MERGARTVRHLYVHIPFCRARCAYCDFASEPLAAHAREDVAERYVSALQEELAWSTPYMAGRLETVYVGGGTPTHLPPEVLVALVRRLAVGGGCAGLGGGASPAPHATGGGGAVAGGPAPGPEGPSGPAGLDPAPLELTVEANPESLDAGLLHALCAAGLTRLSLGVQSFDASLRRALGRSVRDESLARACGVPSACGLSNWNLDLIFGIAGQTWRQVERDVRMAVEAGPAHISLYDLTYTPAYAARVARRLGPEAQARARSFAERHYEDAVALLEREGYRRYEISNFARQGCECVHNLAYWRGRDYLGLGAAAVSTAGGLRWTNVATADAYIARWASRAGKGRRDDEEGDARVSPSADTVEQLSERQRLFERAMLGLRTAEGVRRDEIGAVLDGDRLGQLLAGGLVLERCGTLTLSAGGLNVSNAVLSAILVSPAAE